jgi:single-strand DNA-binding protein
MSSLNKVTLIGNLGNDPDVRDTQGGTTITTISVATTERWKDKDGNVQERTEWHRVKFFNRLAEIAAEYLAKGSQCYIEGSLRTERYTDKDGNEKYSTDIIASELKLLGGRRDSDSGERSERPARSAGNGGGQRPAPRPNERPNGGGGGRGRGSNAGRGTTNQSNDEPFPDDDTPF